MCRACGFNGPPCRRVDRLFAGFVPVQVPLRIKGMSWPGFLSPHRLARHTLVVACLVMVMLGQSWWSSFRAVAMVTGIEVCSAEGSRLVDEQGRPLPSQMSHAGHDCCSGGPVDALVPHVQPLPAMAQRHRTPVDAHRPGWLDAEWHGPLSRGPPLIA